MRKHRLDMTHGARIVTAGLLVLVVLTGAGNLWATYGQVGAVRAAQATAARSAASVTQLCRTGNEFRAEQVVLWEHIATISESGPVPHETAAQKQKRLRTLAAFLTYVRKVFAKHNCGKLLN